ncbi:MAG: hypothetical protein ABTQ73_07425, partial [Caldilineales bacterium]
MRRQPPDDQSSGYGAAPRQWGLLPHTHASPLQRALFVSRGTSSPGDLAPMHAAPLRGGNRRTINRPATVQRPVN